MVILLCVILETSHKTATFRVSLFLLCLFERHKTNKYEFFGSWFAMSPASGRSYTNGSGQVQESWARYQALLVWICKTGPQRRTLGFVFSTYGRHVKPHKLDAAALQTKPVGAKAK